MKRLFILLSLHMAILSGPMAADWEWWNEGVIEILAEEKTALHIMSEQKLIDHPGRIYCQNYGAAVTYDLSNFWAIDAGYLFERERELHNSSWSSWLNEQRVIGSISSRWKWANASLSNRLRFEYRDLEARDNRWRCRDRVKAKHCLGPHLFNASWFISNDLFYSLTEDGFVKNRMLMGLGKDLGRGFEIEIYYMIESKRDGEWKHDINVLGSGVSWHP